MVQIAARISKTIPTGLGELWIHSLSKEISVMNPADLARMVFSDPDKPPLNEPRNKSRPWFPLYMPRMEKMSQAPDSPMIDVSHDRPPFLSTRILVLDDSVEVCHMIKEILKNKGFLVTTVGEEPHARDELMARVDLFITDCNHPGQGGGPFVDSLREDCETGWPAILYQSGYPHFEDCHSQWMVSLLEKPFNQNKLLGACERSLKRRSVWFWDLGSQVFHFHDLGRRSGDVRV